MAGFTLHPEAQGWFPTKRTDNALAIDKVGVLTIVD